MCAPRVTWHTIQVLATHASTCRPRVWQELEHSIDVCRVTRGARIEHL